MIYTHKKTLNAFATFILVNILILFSLSASSQSIIQNERIDTNKTSKSIFLVRKEKRDSLSIGSQKINSNTMFIKEGSNLDVTLKDTTTIVLPFKNHLN